MCGKVDQFNELKITILRSIEDLDHAKGGRNGRDQEAGKEKMGHEVARIGAFSWMRMLHASYDAPFLVYIPCRLDRFNGRRSR